MILEIWMILQMVCLFVCVAITVESLRYELGPLSHFNQVLYLILSFGRIFFFLLPNNIVTLRPPLMAVMLLSVAYIGKYILRAFSNTLPNTKCVRNRYQVSPYRHICVVLQTLSFQKSSGFLLVWTQLFARHVKFSKSSLTKGRNVLYIP